MQKKLVTNPVHPLDLDLNSLIIIYKKFEQAKLYSPHPNHQLPIEIIVQLIAKLTNQEPSALQKSLSKSLYKNTISWNEFLNFLDKESEARQQILNWIMYDTNVKLFRFHKTVNTKFIPHSFEQITYLDCITFDGKYLYVAVLDKIKIVVFEKGGDCSLADFYLKKQRVQFDKFGRTSIKTKYENHSNYPSPQVIVATTKSQMGNRSKLHNNFERTTESVELKRASIQIKKYQRSFKNNTTAAEEVLDEEAYCKKETKKINRLFQIFKDLPLESSGKLADYVTHKITTRRLHEVLPQDVLESYADVIDKMAPGTKKSSYIETETNEQKTNRLKGYFKKMHEDNKNWSYNPHKPNLKSVDSRLANKIVIKKKTNFEKKQKQNYFSISSIAYHPETNLFALALYNFELVLIQLRKQYNKIQFHKHDSIKINKDHDRKKNQIVEDICFHFHTIMNYLQLLIVIRVEKYSYVRCFNIVETRKNSQAAFNLSKEVFIIKMDMQAVCILPEPEYGFHLISHDGFFRTYQDDLKDMNDQNCNDQYYTLVTNIRINNEMIFSCLKMSTSKKKIGFGTFGGRFILLDCFTNQIVFNKKISNSNLVNIVFDDATSQLLLFSSDEQITIIDINKLKEIQVLKVKNQDRLNEKVYNFCVSRFKNQIILHCYGSEIREFISYVDQQRNNRKRKVQSTYKWRLQKLEKSQQLTANNKTFLTDIRLEEIIGVVLTDKHFVTLSRRHELKLLSTKDYHLKYSIILNVHTEQTVIAFNMSRDSKIGVFSLESQSIKIVNVHTQEIYQELNLEQKITHVQFLSERNQYFIVAGVENGSIMFIPSAHRQSKLPNKIVNAHTKALSCMRMISDLMITTSEDSKLIVWQLPFNVIKYQINLADKNQYVVEISVFKSEKILCRTNNCIMYLIDAKQGVIKESYEELVNTNILTFAYNEDNTELFIVDEDFSICTYDFMENRMRSSSSLLLLSSKVSEGSRKIVRKQSRIRKKNSENTSAETVIHWKLKSKLKIRENIDFVQILHNQRMKQTVLFLSKGGFYIYDEYAEKFIGRHSYTGQYTRNQNNRLFMPHNPRSHSTAK